jgi:hypothetical protein
MKGQEDERDPREKAVSDQLATGFPITELRTDGIPYISVSKRRRADAIICEMIARLQMLPSWREPEAGATQPDPGKEKAKRKNRRHRKRILTASYV